MGGLAAGKYGVRPRGYSSTTGQGLSVFRGKLGQERSLKTLEYGRNF